MPSNLSKARLAQSAEHETLDLREWVEAKRLPLIVNVVSVNRSAYCFTRPFHITCDMDGPEL